MYSSLLRPSIAAAEVIDCLDNHSDHRPISLRLTVASRVCNGDIKCAEHQKVKRRYATRWDNANQSEYYELSRIMLDNIDVNACFASCDYGLLL